MAITDPIADMLTRIRNAIMVRHDEVLVPDSRTKRAVLNVLRRKGFIEDYSVLRGGVQSMIKVRLKYIDGQPGILGLERVSKPSLRVYAGRNEIPRVYGGLGIAIVSTSRGIMTGHEAWQQHRGGEILCYIW
ncbi:MAG: 30S ribosomal protein S8 [Chloroflexota bacterium]|nr:30S ribosomal protein S8 [Chloroflexota bacterium]